MTLLCVESTLGSAVARVSTNNSKNNTHDLVVMAKYRHNAEPENVNFK